MSLVSKERLPIVILINYLWPTFTLVASVVLARVAVTRWRWFLGGSAIVLLSIAAELLHDYATMITLVASSRTTDWCAYAIALLGAAAWGVYSAVSRRWGEQSGGAVVGPMFSLCVVTVAGLMLFFQFVPQKIPNWDNTLIYWVMFACTANIAAFWCWDLGIRKGSVIAMSLMADGMPWIALLSAHLVFGSPISDQTIYTALLLVAGAVIYRYGTMARGAH